MHDIAIADHQTQHVLQEPRQFLTFLVAGEVFAADILHIKEIIEYGQLTVVPLMPAFIRGVINLRGTVVPVIDLAVRLGGQRTAVTRRTCIIIIEVTTSGEEGRQVIGMLVDAVNQVLEISSADIEPPPLFGARIRAQFLLGMGKVHDRFIILLDVDRVLAVEEIDLLQQISAPKSALAEI